MKINKTSNANSFRQGFFSSEHPSLSLCIANAAQNVFISQPSAGDHSKPIRADLESDCSELLKLLRKKLLFWSHQDFCLSPFPSVLKCLDAPISLWEGAEGAAHHRAWLRGTNVWGMLTLVPADTRAGTFLKVWIPHSLLVPKHSSSFWRLCFQNAVLTNRV